MNEGVLPYRFYQLNLNLIERRFLPATDTTYKVSETQLSQHPKFCAAYLIVISFMS
jgi:hypothetical protein